MEIKPKLTVSGYRGIWSKDLNKEIIIGYIQAFVNFLIEDLKKEKLTILIGRDGRESGPEIKKIIINTLETLKINAMDGDILPTPTVLFSVRKNNYDAGIIITASHNPIEYNGLKFVNNKGLFVEIDGIKKINEYYNA